MSTSDHGGEAADKITDMPPGTVDGSSDNTGVEAPSQPHPAMFAPPTTTHSHGDSTELMGPILRRKKVVSLPLGAGGEFFMTNDTGGPHRQHMTAHHHEQAANNPHANRRKQRSEGVGSIGGGGINMTPPATVAVPVEEQSAVPSGRMKQQTPPSMGGGRSRQKQNSHEFNRFMQGVVRRKQVSLDLLGPNDFFATEEETQDLMIEPIDETVETKGEDGEVVGDDEMAGAAVGEKQIFRPLRFSKPLVAKGKRGGHGGGHGGGGGGGHSNFSGDDGCASAPIDEEVAQAFQRYATATAELEEQVKMLEEQLKQQEDSAGAGGNNNDSLRKLRASCAKTQSARQIEETFIKSKLNMSIIAEEIPLDEEDDAVSHEHPKKEEGTINKDDEVYQEDDGIIRAGRGDKIKAGICFLLMLALTITVACWDTHLDEEGFITRPVGLACVTDCVGNTETRDFFGGHNHLLENQVIRLLMHVDPNEPANEHQDHMICEIYGEETGQLKATVKFPPPDAEERKTVEKRITVDWDHPEEPHHINVVSESLLYSTGFTLQAEPLTPLARYSELVAAIIMCTVYLFILLEVIHRTLVAILGSMVALMFLFIMEGGTTESIQHIMLNLEWSTLGLLFGMMLIVGELSHTGVFEFCAVRLLMASKGSFVRLIILLCTLTAVASAFLDNVTTMLLVAPVTIDLCNILDVDPRPYLIGEVILSNIGGTATLIGDPPNIIIGSSFEEIGFVDFITNVLPCIFLFCIPASLALIVWIYRYYLTTKEMKALEIDKLKKTYPIYDEPRLMIAGTTCFFVIIMFFLHPVHHKDTAWIALLGAFVTIAFTNPHDVQDALRNHVEWDTLLFFAGLFVLVEACAAMGLLSMIGEALANYIEQQPEDKQTAIAITLIIWVSAITSAFLDNIPYTATMIPVIEILANQLPTLDLVTLAWALSFGACLGGNGTLLGASANIVTAGISTTRGYEISFLNFLYPGMLVMVVTTAIANLYMLVRYAWV